METKMIKGGYLVPVDGCLGKFQIETDSLVHDTHLPPLVCSFLKEGNCIIDAGAFNGDHAKAYSDKVGKDGMVIAVEAGNLAFECLKHNVQMFAFKNVLPLHTALSESCGEIVLHSVNEENLGMSTCEEIGREELKEGDKYLMTTTIDYLAEESKRKIDFIKIDVEGFESKVLIGASKTIQKDRPGLLIEVNSEALMEQDSHPDEIFEILRYHNYTWEIAQPEAVLGDPQFDILCFPVEEARPSIFKPQEFEPEGTQEPSLGSNDDTRG